ncbi:MAG: phosphonate C-P lyase system protein PhnH [Desulfobaccales bacterium]
MKEISTNAACLVTQRTFRVLLQAMSHPGAILALPECGLEFGWQMLLPTLLDQEVTFAVLGNDRPRWEREIRQLTGCPPAGVSVADFLIVPEGDSHGELVQAKRGTLEYPDTGATVIYLVETLEAEARAELGPVCRGPGIRDQITPGIKGLGIREFLYLQEINREFPLGIDTIFLDRGNRLMCLPRSSRIEVR